MSKAEDEERKALDYAVSLIEEGIAISEEQHKVIKNETAHNAGLSLKKMPVEISKDPIASSRFFHEAMKPVREMAHNTAKSYILNNVASLKNKGFNKLVKKMIHIGNVDDAIKIRIIASKIGNIDPVKTYLYKEIA